MSSSIWTQCGGSSNSRPIALRPWRVVEAQHVVSTRKLVDTDEEQRVLEQLLETSKPPLPPPRESRGLHYLLITPFRYPPLRHGSRFGGRHERGIWYGARELRTAFAEVAYYRLLFLEGTRGDLPPLISELSAFRVPVRTARGVDLTAPPFARFRARVSSLCEYDDSQLLGAEMRRAGVDAFRYFSARDARGGTGVGIFSPRAFAAMEPARSVSWLSVLRAGGVEFKRRQPFSTDRFEFSRESFLVEGTLPAPAP